jgi:hypothetical protein
VALELAENNSPTQRIANTLAISGEKNIALETFICFTGLFACFATELGENLNSCKDFSSVVAEFLAAFIVLALALEST